MAESLIQVLIQERDSLLTDTLAEELVKGLILLKPHTDSNNVVLMIEQFVGQVEELTRTGFDRSLGRPHDSNIQSKGKGKK